MEKEDVIIRNGILHILDTAKEGPVFSDYLLDMTQDAADLLRGQIYHLAADDDIKDCVFDEENSEFFKALYGFTEDQLTSFSRAASEEMYRLMKENAAIPDGDLIFATCQIYSTMYLAIIKMGYRTVFTHNSEIKDDSAFNYISRHAGVLPQASSKPSEGVLINLYDYSLRLAEKKFEIDGKKDYYLSSRYLGCHGKLSQKSKMDIVTKAVEKLNDEFYPDDYQKDMEVKSVLKTELVEEGSIKLETIPEKIYPENTEAREKLTETIEKYNLKEEEIKPSKPATTKKLEKQFLVTDTGIEINIPMEQYTEGANVEFITNDDGTISVLIKNISHISAK